MDGRVEGGKTLIHRTFLATARVPIRDLYTFAPKKYFCQLLQIPPTHFILLKTFNSEFSYVEVWLTDQNSKPLEIKDKKHNFSY